MPGAGRWLPKGGTPRSLAELERDALKALPAAAPITADKLADAADVTRGAALQFLQGWAARGLVGELPAEKPGAFHRRWIRL